MYMCLLFVLSVVTDLATLQLGMIGILERENAAVLNESLKLMATATIKAFGEALRKLDVRCPFYLTQNDGTLIRWMILFCICYLMKHAQIGQLQSQG